MKNKTYIYLYGILLICVSFYFTSCINIERNIKINPDGSGYEVVNFIYQKEFFQSLIALVSAFDSNRVQSYTDSLYNDDIFLKDMKIDVNDKKEGIKINSVKSRTNPDSSKTVTIDYNFDNINLISESLAKEKSDIGGKGKTEVIWKEKNGRKYFAYIYKNIKKDSNQNTDSSNVSNMMNLSSFFKDNKLYFNIEFPHEIISSNANFTEGKKLRWEIALDKLVSSDSTGFKLEAEMK